MTWVYQFAGTVQIIFTGLNEAMKKLISKTSLIYFNILLHATENESQQNEIYYYF